MHTSTCRAYAYLTNQYIYLAPFGKPLRLVVHILIFVDPGVKINGAYYRDVLLAQHQKSGSRRLFYFSAGQCARQQSKRNRRNAKKKHTTLHSSHSMASEQFTFEFARL